MRFVDFLLTFEDASAEHPKRFEDLDADSQTSEINLAGSHLFLTRYHRASHDLIHNIKSDLWNCWVFGEIQTYSNDFGATQQHLNTIVDDLNAGRLCPESLNGNFALLAYEAKNSRWHIWTNRLGTYHIYYGASNKRNAVGSFFHAVAETASDHHLNWVGLAGFFSFGFFPANHTYFTDVQILRPASHYIFSRTGHLESQSRYWEWKYQPRTTRPFSKTVDDFADLFGTVVSEQIKEGSITIPISGGLDSRSIIAALSDNSRHNHISTYSYGYEDNSPETAIAGQIAAARHLPFQEYVLTPYLFDKLPLIIDSVEGFQDLVICRQAGVIDQLKGQSEFILGGHVGDLWFDDVGALNRVFDEQDSLIDFVKQKIVKPGSLQLVQYLCESNLGAPIEEVLHHLIEAELERLSNIDELDFLTKVYKLEQWVFRWTFTSLRMFQPASFPRLPFCDTRIIDFFCEVPTIQVSGRKMQVEYLKRYAPDLAKIVWQKHDANLYQYQSFHTYLLPKRIYKKLKRFIQQRQSISRNWEIQLLQQDGLVHLNNYLTGPDSHITTYFSQPTVEGLLTDLYKKKQPQHAHQLGILLTLESWLRRTNYAIT